MKIISRPKFLIVSNMRSGSTWLQGMLGSLPSVFSDYEFKWRPTYPASPVHWVINGPECNIARALDSMAPEASIVGSKLVLDPVHLSIQEFADLSKTLASDIRIIHLSRNYRQIFVSRHRGVGHRPNPDRSSSISSLIISNTIDKSFAAFQIAEKVRRPQEVMREEVLAELDTFISNDEWVASLCGRHDYYMSIDYENIKRDFENIAQFVGADEDSNIISQCLACSPLLRLPITDDASIVSNIDDFHVDFESYEQRRLKTIVSPSIV